MAFDEHLAARVRNLVEDNPTVEEKRMFGGLAFLTGGNMSVGVHGSELIVRIAPLETPLALREPGVRAFDITGRPMKGWLLVSASAIAEDATLAAWVNRGLTYAASLPTKKQ